MSSSARITVVILAAVALLAFGGASSAVSPKPVIRSQAPCTTGGNFCVYFEDDDTIPVIRQFDFSVPGAGAASVSFTGSLYCLSSSDSQTEIVDVTSQIVGQSTAVPSLTGPSALRLAVRFVPVQFGPSTTFSLASTRVFNYGSGGTKHVYFKIARSAMHADTACYVYDAAFNVVFIP